MTQKQYNKYNEQDINKILRSGQLKKQIDLINYTFLETEILKESENIELSQFKKMMTILLFIKENLSRIWESRESQISSYKWAVYDSNNKDIEFSKMTKFYMNKILSYVIDVPSYGQMLIGLKKIRKKDAAIGTEWELEPVLCNQTTYRRRMNINSADLPYYIYDNSPINDQNFYDFIYIQDNRIYSGGILKQLALLSMIKNAQYKQWSNNNDKLLGIITAIYDWEKLQTTVTEQNSTSINANGQDGYVKTETVLNEVMKPLQAVQEYNVAMMPDSIKLGLEQIADSGVAESFDRLISKIDINEEIQIKGQAGTTQMNNVGSFALAKEMNLTTADIKWADLKNAGIAEQAYVDILLRLNHGDKAPDYTFKLRYDEDKDVQAYLNKIQTLGDTTNNTNTGKQANVITVQSFYSGIDEKIPDGYYDSNDTYIILGDQSKQDFANKLNKADGLGLV